jgi:CDP-diacylglycerol--glycerol-3-phosphate 3-phosphatidyltransferase
MKYLPNTLTIFRMVLTPVFIWLAIYVHTTSALQAAWMVFVVAALTDWLDGSLARKYNVVSNFGKIWDPLADKFIVLSALAALVWKAPFALHWLIFVIISIREAAVTVLREVYARKQIVIPADQWGKLKTVLQMVGIVASLGLWAIGINNPKLNALIQGWFWLVMTVTVLSGINYLRAKRSSNHPG